MNSSLKVVVSAGLLAMLIVGCGSDGDGKNVSTSDLKGNWVGSCKVDGTASEQDFFEFTSDRINIRNIEYDNPTCNNKDSDILVDNTRIFDYNLGDDFKTTSGKDATKMDLKLKGFIEDKGDLPVKPVIGTSYYALAYIENKKLFHGKIDADHNGTTDATRPVAIDFLDPATKQ